MLATITQLAVLSCWIETLRVPGQNANSTHASVHTALAMLQAVLSTS